MGELIRRSTSTYTVAQLGSISVHVAYVRVSLPDATKSPFDLGSFVYSRREIPDSRISVKISSEPVPTDVSSIRTERFEVLSALVDWIFTTSNKELSIYTKLVNYRQIFDWIDQNNHSGFFLSPNHARQGYLDFITDLNHQFHAEKKIEAVRCASLQTSMKNLIEYKFGESLSPSIVAGVPPFRFDRYSQSPIPREALIRKQIRVLIDLAHEVSEAVMSDRLPPYPLIIAGEQVCVMGSQHATLSTERSPIDITTIDTSACVVRTWLEVLTKYHLQPSEAKNRVASTTEHLKKFNNRPFCLAKKHLASLALMAYANLFIFITGAHASELVQFDYDNALLVTEDTLNKQLKAIKLRARGKETKYIVGRNTGIPLLKSYIRFRNWLLGDIESPFLFIKFSSDKNNTFGPLDKKFQSSFFSRMRKLLLDPDTPNIPPKMARKIKSLVLHELEHAPWVVAKNLNHTEEVNSRSYSDQPLDKQRNEFKDFWSAIRKTVELVRERHNQKATSIAAGQCDNINHPKARDGQIPVQPSCESQLGCLNCVHYSCHADEEDLHKILSMEYTLNTVRTWASSRNQTNRLFKEILLRIQEITNAIEAINPAKKALVKSVKHRVFELGDITPFWELRLQRYEQMGLI
ncbi:hypothetical protein ABE521_25630 [Pseudomonas sp. TWI672]|uniref:hypothetical protein n=1 Tax=unclassified Pseudomonas TaxID=196821 RepID=UPI0032083D2C